MPPPIGTHDKPSLNESVGSGPTAPSGSSDQNPPKFTAVNVAQAAADGAASGADAHAAAANDRNARPKSPESRNETQVTSGKRKRSPASGDRQDARTSPARHGDVRRPLDSPGSRQRSGVGGAEADRGDHLVVAQWALPQSSSHGGSGERDEQQHSNINAAKSNHTDAQIADLLRNDAARDVRATASGGDDGPTAATTQHAASDGRSTPNGSPATVNSELQHHQHHRQSQQHSSPSSPQQLTPGMAAPSLQKQRKRNFSNRTKTGCLTCRERKKKCDEGKPTCNNCERGGFRCKGYQQTPAVYRTQPMIHTARLQAKSGSGFDFPHYQFPTPTRTMSYIPPNHRPMSSHPLPPASHQPPPPPPSVGAPHDLQDPSRSLPLPQETSVHMRPSTFGRPWADEHPASGLSAFGQQSHQPPPPPPPPSHHEMHHQQTPFGTSEQHNAGPKTLLPPPAPMHPSHHQQQPPQTHRNSISATSPYSTITAAQLALQQHPSQTQGSQASTPRQQAPPLPLSAYRTEKEKMVNGLPYSRGDPQLKEERRRCTIACNEFNQSALNPNLNEEDLAQLFRRIVETRHDTTSATPELISSRVGGKVGKGVAVEAPFTCEYGYNIEVGDDTEIGAGCRIFDGCRVRIGARCIIGPDVHFYATDGDHQNLHTLPPGHKRNYISRTITVEDDVFIGGHSILIGGCTVGKKCTIGAGTLVTGEQRINSPFLAYNPTSVKVKGYWAQSTSYASSKLEKDLPSTMHLR